ncbi:mitochondrial ATPase expression-domain-containing protein [Lasiosphaeria miniovina]|uniref:Mitochondrial ATPase expression-domain-containing protein n=1 Tax=Lasiosphaeria miniovina TaxID=1954250 RepID=A0AA39ZUM3_9PEZI|nr:mitochondrial ATPase expression-domain-containing protein [Lasiosphaeria miniovina]KAK0703854.1 mitochondrial ATPase expression-domain-containing protein [Lasiosphaeria miniovina]
MNALYLSADFCGWRVGRPRVPRLALPSFRKPRVHSGLNSTSYRWLNSRATDPPDAPAVTATNFNSENSGAWQPETRNYELSHAEWKFLRRIFVPPTREPPPKVPSRYSSSYKLFAPRTSISEVPDPNFDPTGSDLVFAKSFKDPLERSEYLRELLAERGEREKTTLARLPPTAFSELLRSLDPLTLAAELDPTVGINVNPGVALSTSLGSYFDIFGVRTGNVLLLERVFAAVQLRILAKRPIILSDFKVLFRCAGAASDPMIVHNIFLLMKQAGELKLRESGLVDEYIKSRYLTEHSYNQYDLARSRVRAIDLHNTKLLYGRNQTYRLRAATQLALSPNHRFGQTRHSYIKVESLRRVTRLREDALNLFRKMIYHHNTMDERVCCALMVALGTTGSLTLLEGVILKRFFGIKVIRVRESGISKSERRHNKNTRTADVIIEGDERKHTPPGSITDPTKRLLDAVVSSYCRNGEIVVALKLVDFLALRYNIRIPDQTWFDILQWTYLYTTNPARSEWIEAGFPGRATTHESVQLVWDTMTTEYKIQPGFLQYTILIKSLIRRNRIVEAMEYMLELEPYYKRIEEEAERAYYNQTLVLGLGLDLHEARQAWPKAQVRKEATWHAFHSMCAILMDKISEIEVDEELATRTIPQFIGIFRNMFRNVVKYKIPGGVVELYKIRTIHRPGTWEDATCSLGYSYQVSYHSHEEKECGIG